MLLVLLNLLIQGLLSSLDLELIISFKSRDLLGHDLSLGELLHSCLHSMQLSLDLVDGFLKLAFLSGHCQLSLVSDHVNTLGGRLLEDPDALVDAQGRSFLLFLKPEKGGLLPLASFLQKDLSIKKLLVSLVLAVDHEFESVYDWWGNIFPSVRLKFQDSIKPMNLHLLLKHGFFVIHHPAQRNMLLSVDSTPSYFDSLWLDLLARRGLLEGDYRGWLLLKRRLFGCLRLLNRWRSRLCLSLACPVGFRLPLLLHLLTLFGILCLLLWLLGL